MALFSLICLFGSIAWGAPRAVVVDNSGSLSIVDLETQPPTAQQFLQGQLTQGQVFDVAITPDKKYALVTESMPKTLRRIDISDPANPVPAGTLDIGMWANDIAVSPDGTWAVISDSAYFFNTTIAFVDLVNFKLNGVYTLTTPGGSAQAVAIAPDNKTVIIADANNGRIISGAIRGDSAGLTSENVYAAPLSPRNVAISPDGSTVLAVSYGGQSLYAYQITATGVLTPTATVTGLPAGGQSVAFAPDGKTAYTVHDGTSPKMVVLDVAGPSQISVTAMLPLPVAPSGYFGADTLAVTSDGRYAVATDAALSAAPTLAVIDLTTFAVSSVTLAADEPRGVAFIPQIPPTITGDPATTALVGDGYSFTPGSTGATSFDIKNAPSWALFDKARGALTGVPDAKGTFSGIVITAKNEDGSTPLPAFDITVPNRPPALSGTVPASVAAGEPYTFTPTASDPDGDALTFSITGKPAWASFDSSTGTLSGTPDATQVASFGNVVISVSDGEASATLPAFAITVTPGMLTCATPASITVPPTNSTGRLTVQWGASATPGVSYVLEQSSGNGFTTAYSGSATGASVNITQDGEYTFRVKAVKTGLKDSGYRTAGNASVVNLVCGTPGTMAVPASNSTGSIFVRWGASDVTGVTYILEQKLGDGPFSPVYSGTSTYTTLKISQNGTYSFQVRAIKTGYGNSEYQTASNACIVDLACATPGYLNVPASTNSGSVLVTWGTSDVSGVTYVLERKLESGSFAPVYSGPNTYATVPFTQSGSYSFQVKAIKGGYDDSAYKAAANACAVDLTCGAPSSLTVPTGNSTGSITVSWGPSNLAGVTYILEQQIDSGDFVRIYSGTATFSYTVRATQNGSYSYRIKAIKGGFVDSAYLDAGNSCTVRLACGAPAYLTVPASNSTGTVLVTWGPSNISGVTYVLEQKLGNGSFGPVYTGSSTSAYLNLPGNGSYTFQVKAVKIGYADSGYTEGASPCTVNLVCGLPTVLTVPASDSTGSIRISWGASDVAGVTYVLEKKQGEGEFTQAYSGTATSTTVKITQNGTYTFQLRATRSGYGDSGYRVGTCVVTLVCGTPGPMTVPVSNSTGSVYVSWGASDVPGVTYILEQKLGDGAFTEAYRGTSTYTTVKISQSGSYSFQVRAIKTDYGNSGYRTAPNACIVDLACGTPGYLNVPASTNTGSVLVTWGTSDVSGVTYVLERKLGTGSFAPVYSGPNTYATVPFTQSGSYSFQVKAVKDGYDDSAYKAAANACAVDMTCGAPSSLKVPTVNSTGSITVSWGASSLAGVTYVLEQKIGSGDFVRVYSGTAAFSYTVRVSQDGIYSYRIKAVKAGFVDSAYLEAGNNCTVRLACGAPAYLTVPLGNSTGTVLVTWGSSDVSGVTYVLEQQLGSGAFVPAYTGSYTSANVKVPQNGTYTFQVKAIKGGYGDSSYRPGSNTCTVNLVCGLPTSLTVPPGNSTGSINISWGASDVAGVTYVLEQKLGDGSFTQAYSGTSTYTTVKVSENGSYTFQLRATKSGYRDSGYREGTCAVNLVCGTPGPMAVPASNSTGSVYVSWGASDVTGVTYILEQKLGDGSFTQAYSGTSTYTTLKISQNGTYSFQIRAIKTGYGNSEYRTASNVCVVDLACATPGYLNVPASTNSGSVLVTWGTSDVSGVTYVLERKLEGGSFAPVYSGPNTYATVPFTQSGSYSFQVKAIKGGYDDSAYKAAANACAVDLTCGAPSSLTVPTGNSTGSITVSWGPSNLAGVTYILEQQIDSGDFVRIYSGTATFSTTVIATRNGIYSFRIKAEKAGFAGSGYREAAISCNVQLTCGAPAFLTVPASNSTGTFVVSWGSSDVNGVTYVLEQSANGGEYQEIYRGTLHAATVNVTGTGSYSYRVKAIRDGYGSVYKYSPNACVVS